MVFAVWSMVVHVPCNDFCFNPAIDVLIVQLRVMNKPDVLWASQCGFMRQSAEQRHEVASGVRHEVMRLPVAS